MIFVKKIWREVLLVISAGAFAYLMYIFAVARPEDTTAQSFVILGILASGAVSVLLIRSLWRDKWQKKATEAMQRLFVRLQNFFDKFATTLGISRKSKTVLGGKTTIIFDKAREAENFGSARQKKPPKWKHLESDRLRMRYLYRQMVVGKIKKGAYICASDTPICIKTHESKSESENRLFDLYIACRYDERKLLNGEELKELKEKLEIK